MPPIIPFVSPDKQSSPFREIMKSIRQRIIENTEINPSYVVPVATAEYKIAIIEDRFIYIHYTQFQPDVDAGVGRRARRGKRNIRVYLYMRSNLDSFGTDEVALLEQLGMADFEEQVNDALDTFMPYTQDSGFPKKLCIEPLHRLDDAEMVERKPEDDIGLIRFSQVYEVDYIPPTISPYDQEAILIP